MATENSVNPKFHASPNALNFNPCGYTFSIPSSSVVEASCYDEELEYFNVRNCRQQHQRTGGNVDNVKTSALPEFNLTRKLFQNISSEKGVVDIRLRQTKMQEISPSDGNGLFSIGVTEEVLCVSRNNKIEKFECHGTIGISYLLEKNIDNQIAEYSPSEKVMSTSITLKNHEGVLESIKGNSSFILAPLQPAGKEQVIVIENIPINAEKKMAILKYSTVQSFQPFYIKARNKLKVQQSSAKLIVQIILNPLYKILFKNATSLNVQASLSCFNFDKGSKVIMRPCDNFNENSKIITWVCDSKNTDLEANINLEAVIEGVSFSKEEFEKNIPEQVPLIVKAKFQNTSLTNVRLGTHGDIASNIGQKEVDVFSNFDEIQVEGNLDDNGKFEKIVFQSAVEFRFF